MKSQSWWPRAVLAIAVVALAGGGPAPGVADDPLARALVEQRARVAASPGDSRVHNDLGNLLALVGDVAGAEAAYRQAIELDPESATAHYNLGRLLASQQQRRAARRELGRAIDLDPAHAAARYHLGALYDDWHRPRAARRWYRRAFELDPSLADPAKNPHVVGNCQALAAQLLTWQDEPVPGPTREYEQPGRVMAAVAPAVAEPPPAPLVPVPEEPPAAEPAAESGGFARLTSPAAGAPPAVEEKIEDPIELDRESLRRPRERATKGGDSTGGAPAGVVLDAGTLGPRSTINQVVGPGGGVVTGRPQPGRRPPMFQQPRDFLPGRDSTGRIERGLEPADPARPAIG